MNEHLFDHIDIPRENIHIPDGTLADKDVEKFCFEYEQNIVKYGGIDIQILGIGKTGHIGEILEYHNTISAVLIQNRL